MFFAFRGVTVAGPQLVFLGTSYTFFQVTEIENQVPKMGT